MFSLIQAANKNRVTLFTTHNMEEADSLCNRIGILINGQFVCIGSSNYLKSTYGMGYECEMLFDLYQDQEGAVKGGDGGMTNSDESMIRLFQGALKETSLQVQVIESYPGYLKLSIHGNEVTAALPSIFTCLEGIKNKTTPGINVSLRDYSVSATTLESVFLKFCKLQQQDAHAP